MRYENTKESSIMGANKTVDKTSDQDEIKVVKLKNRQANSNQPEDSETQQQNDDKTNGDKAESGKTEIADKDKNSQEKKQQSPAKKSENKKTSTKTKKTRSKKYQAVRSKVDRTKTYDPFAAIELVKKLSYTNFTGTITAHLNVNEQGLTKELTLPHSTGKSRNIEIATEETLEKIEAGEIDFDVLLASPKFMSKITKYAPILGPKGLMPNPKNNTLTPNPKQRKKELAAGTMTLKTERRNPIIHVVIGKTDMDSKKLTENLKKLIDTFKRKIKKLTISATMSPGIKVEVKDEEQES